VRGTALRREITFVVFFSLDGSKLHRTWSVGSINAAVQFFVEAVERKNRRSTAAGHQRCLRQGPAVAGVTGGAECGDEDSVGRR
jgi:hypothetical protein